MCSMSVTYQPAQTKFTTTTVTLTNLVPKSNYTISILSENGATSSAPASRPAAQVTFTTLESGSAKPNTPKKVSFLVPGANLV